MRGLVFVLDDDYVVQFKVLWHSLIQTQSLPPETPVFVLHEDTLGPSSISELTELVESGGLRITFIDLTAQAIQTISIHPDEHFHKATFFRLYVASNLPIDLSSVVYLDLDAVVIRSIKELFEINLTHPIAAVDHLSPGDGLRLWGEGGGNYFQAGVLVIDLDEWRRANRQAGFQRIMASDRDRIQWHDQCVLNLAFKDNWQRLPIWFNVCNSVRSTIDEPTLEKRIRFLHLDGSRKPWKYALNNKEARVWYQAYEDALGVPFDLRSVRRPLWRRVASAVKRMFC